MEIKFDISSKVNNVCPWHVDILMFKDKGDTQNKPYEQHSSIGNTLIVIF